MTDVATRDQGADFEFTAAHFRQIAAPAHQRYGLSLAETKKPLVYSRLAKRLRARGLTDFDAYLTLVTTGSDAAEETAFITALTTNVTSFFREKHHFDILRERGIDAITRRLAASGKARLWSAGCSSGEEAFSIAMTLRGRMPDIARADVKILATDIDPSVVDRARRGIYPAESVAQVPQELREAYMLSPPDAPGMVSMTSELRNMIRFAELNLMSDWPFSGPFDIIFCRNVAIYFDKPTQARLWHRFADLLIDGGLLFIGHSERVAGPAEQHLSSIGITAYAKRPTAAH